MISRRNIRVKVMQTLYTWETLNEGITPASDPVALLRSKINQTQDLFVYLLYFLTEVARYAEKDAYQKAQKHLPTPEDLNVNTRISGNTLVQKALETPAFTKACASQGVEQKRNEGLVRKIYTELCQSDEYKDYVALPQRDKKAEKKILEHVFTQLMLPSEEFIQHVEECFINWDDDAEQMYALMLNYLSKPEDIVFSEILSSEKWAFASSLLSTALDKKDVTLDLIKPKLKNWDADRIAALDLILLRLGICEFLFFETIPTKVTINEYIDIAKSYSTVHSGQFVNGLLDNIHKALTAENKIHKKQYKNSTL